MGQSWVAGWLIQQQSGIVDSVSLGINWKSEVFDSGLQFLA